MAHHVTPATSPIHRRHASWTMLLSLLAVAAVLYLLIPHLGAFRASADNLRRAEPLWLGVALLLLVTSYLAAGASYWVLAKKPVSLVGAIWVQFASSFVNRLVPAGVGAVTMNFDFLSKNRHTPAAAGSVIAANNALSISGNILLLLLAIPLAPVSWHALQLPHSRIYWLAGLVLIIGVGAVLWSRHLRREVVRFALGLQRNLLQYRTHPLRLLGGLIFSLAVTLSFTLCLAACAQAVGVTLTLPQALVVMSAGVLLGTATPTPGGLVGAEAGLFAGCVAYGMTSAHALAVALLFRFFTYWLSLPVGLAALLFSERAGYV